uniref:Coiled-coil domain containing 191 n=1 Tax=Salarias fasciatus TaxID=181472 RepID=A0A672G8E7_SALFA
MVVVLLFLTSSDDFPRSQSSPFSLEEAAIHRQGEFFVQEGNGLNVKSFSNILKFANFLHLYQRVELASEFAVSEVFSQKKPQSGISTRVVSLQSSDQLRDHDDAYSEAHALLGDWLGSKLRLELETDDDDEPVSAADFMNILLSAIQKYLDLYNHLAEEEEQSTINNILQDLMKQEVLGPELMVDLVLDAGQTRKKFRDPALTMEVRHQQVREKRDRREAERRRQQRERAAQQGSREEAKRREREEERKRRQEERRQEEMVQQEMAKLRRQMEERRRGLEQLARQRYSIHSHQRCFIMYYCLQKHFSGWFSVVLNQRLRMGKARALCEWKMRLRAWRGWRAVVWTERQRREEARTEQELRTENRQSQLAVESDRRRLLRRCLNEWRLWCRGEKERRELVAQQEETRRKMAALISAAATGKLSVAEPQRIVSPPEAPSQSEAKAKVKDALTNHCKLLKLLAEDEKTWKRQQELLKVARQHYHTALLLRRGLAPWKRLIQLRQDSMKLAETHHNLLLLRRCILYWHQSARESLSEKEACADQLYRCFLLRRSLSCWKRVRIHPPETHTHTHTLNLNCASLFQLKDLRLIQEERAERFHRTRTLRKFLLALQTHVTQERLVERERQELAREHDNRSAASGLAICSLYGCRSRRTNTIRSLTACTSFNHKLKCKAGTFPLQCT